MSATTDPGGVRLGAWATLGEPRGAAALEASGLDWLLLDMQHGHFDDRAVRETLALRRSPLVPLLVRPPSDDPAGIGRALDSGADGVIVPLVESAAQAEAVVAAAHLPPRGGRSLGLLHGVDRVPGPGGPKPFVAVMVETAAGLDRVEEIAATAGLDMVFVGPFDLSLALGTTIPALLEERDGVLARVLAACRTAGVLAGAFGAGRPEAFARLGFDWVAAALDTELLASGAALAARVRRSIEG
ncbi:aldolase/citrate lyase family protein [Amnibacterium sp. CER49]|uniref:HpcH/HpaI aldolase family protein n=1 Tax=Amnibacterium sp. CER49 TaxID=3039161 RepID=UPI0024485990|nr:aldolase/citrate lyase family protein [Amnibacterium sp. CER49]MDH2445019.1 aldolase/citrate lyase family protein [Amnibacterium sp. CER49]